MMTSPAEGPPPGARPISYWLNPVRPRGPRLLTFAPKAPEIGSGEKTPEDDVTQNLLYQSASAVGATNAQSAAALLEG